MGGTPRGVPVGSSPQHGARAPSTGPEPGGGGRRRSHFLVTELQKPWERTPRPDGDSAQLHGNQAPGALPASGVKKCKKDKYNGKGKISAGAAPTRAAAPAWKSPFPCSVPGMCPRAGSGQPGAAGRARAPVCPWVHSPAISLASVCVYIFIYIYLYLCLSLSHTALLIEEEQTAKQEVWMGEPV